MYIRGLLSGGRRSLHHHRLTAADVHLWRTGGARVWRTKKHRHRPSRREMAHGFPPFFCSMFFFPTVEEPVTFTIIHLSADLTLRIQCSAFLLEIFVSDSGASLWLHGNLCCTAFSGKLSRWRTAKLLGLVVGSENKIEYIWCNVKKQ